MVNSSTFQYLLGVFGLSLSIKGPVQRQFELLQNQTKVCSVKYLKEKCSSLYWTIRTSHRKCYVKNFFPRKNLCYSLQDYNNIDKKLQYRCFSCEICDFFFFFFFWTSILKNTCKRLLLENIYTYNNIYVSLNNSS